MEYFLPSFLALHKDHPELCRWFSSLRRQEKFTTAVWKASRDKGYDAYRNFLLGKIPLPVPRNVDPAKVDQSDCSGGRSTSKAKTHGRSAAVPKQPPSQTSTESAVSL